MLSATRLLAVARTEYLQLRRDKRSLMLAFLVPAQMLLLFGYAVSWDVRDVALGVMDDDHTFESRLVTDAFRASGYFNIVSAPRSPAEAEALLRRGEARAVLVIPRLFSRSVDRGSGAKLQLMIDGSDANTATIVVGYSQAIVSSIALGATTAPALLALAPDTRVWYNQTLETRNMIIPGLIASIMMLVGSMLSAVAIAREWERGTMEQLIATPVDRRELVIGKLLPYLAIGFTDVSMIALVGTLWFGVPFRGSIAYFAVTSFVYLVGTCSLGVWIGASSKTQFAAIQFDMLLAYLPSFLLSGASLDLASMPRVLQILSYAVPARYYVTTLKGIVLKGAGVGILWPELVALVIYAGFAMTLCVRTMHKRLAT